MADGEPALRQRTAQQVRRIAKDQRLARRDLHEVQSVEHVLRHVRAQELASCIPGLRQSPKPLGPRNPALAAENARWSIARHRTCLAPPTPPA